MEVESNLTYPTVRHTPRSAVLLNTLWAGTSKIWISALAKRVTWRKFDWQTGMEMGTRQGRDPKNSKGEDHLEMFLRYIGMLSHIYLNTYIYIYMAYLYIVYVNVQFFYMFEHCPHQDMLLLCKQCKSSSCKAVLSYIEQLADGSLVLMPDGWQSISLEHDARLLQMVDWNRDNISDLVVSDRIFQRNPSAAASFTRRKGAQNPFGGLAFSSGEPHLVDWDGDGDLDLLVVEYNGTHPKIRIFELLDTGELVEVTLKYDHIPPYRHRNGLQFLDWNNDGDVDLVVSTSVKMWLFTTHTHQNDKHRDLVWYNFHPFSVLLDRFQVLTPDGVLHFFDNHNGVLSEQPDRSMRISGVPNTAMLSTFHTVDWDGDGDVDVILGPVTHLFHSSQYFYTLGYYLEQVNGTLIYRPDHPLSSALRLASFGREQDLSWKILDCDGDGNLDIIRFQMRPSGLWSLEVDFLTGPFVGSCSQKNGELKCDNSCFKDPAAYTHLEVGRHGHLTAGDWDGDGDLDILGIAAGHNSPLIFFDQNYCLPPTPCSGIGRCKASGRCACGTERDLEDCSGCSASHYTVSKTPGLSLVHRCAPCPMKNNQVCAGRGVCVDDIYARAVGNSWDLGNGSCVCAAASFNGTDQFFRQTCAEGTCPGGFQEVHMPAEHLKHPKIETCLACQLCNPGTSAPAGGRCESCNPGHFSTKGSDSCHPCPAGTGSQTVGAVECNPCPAGTFAPLGSAVCQMCPEGSISSSGSATCEPCNSQSIFWIQTDSENLSCIRPSEQYLILLLFFASSSVCCFFVATALAYRIPVSDISTQNDGAVVTTHGAHRVLQASSVTCPNTSFFRGRSLCLLLWVEAKQLIVPLKWPTIMFLCKVFTSDLRALRSNLSRPKLLMFLICQLLALLSSSAMNASSSTEIWKFLDILRER